MNKASQGLRLDASSRTVALADMSVDQIAAGLSAMSDDDKAALAAKLAPKAAEGGDGGGNANGGGDGAPPAGAAAGAGKKKKEMKEGEDDDDDEAKSEASVRAEERARISAVFASEHYEGREALANELLGTDLSAEQIIGVLAKTPEGSKASDQVLDAIRASNPNLGTGGTDTGAGQSQDRQSLWDKAIAANNPTKKAR